MSGTMSAIPGFIVGKIIATDHLNGKSSPVGAKGKSFIKRIAEAGDDLQWAGLTQKQIGLPPPLPINPSAPTPAEIRRLAIYNNYHALMDTSAGGGFGIFFGLAHGPTAFGREYIAFAQPHGGGALFTVMAQIPETFNAKTPLILTAPSSGSRGIYGAVSIAEWAFKNGCAIAYTDKGTGPGFHDLDSDTTYSVDGLPLPKGSKDEAVFKAALTEDLKAYKSALPHRLAIKHAHSETNVERNWGEHVRLSIGFCLFCLNDWLGEKSGPFNRKNTKVIASGVSNGGGSALRAAEGDKDNLIDAVVVSEPQIQPVHGDFIIRFQG